MNPKTAPVDTVKPDNGLEVYVEIKALTISDRIAGFGLMLFTGFAIALFGRAGMTFKQGPEINLKIRKPNRNTEYKHDVNRDTATLR